MLSGEMPTSLAIVLVLQRFFGFGGCETLVITRLIVSLGICVGLPRPPRSRSPSRPFRSNRLRPFIHAFNTDSQLSGDIYLSFPLHTPENDGRTQIISFRDWRSFYPRIRKKAFKPIFILLGYAGSPRSFGWKHLPSRTWPERTAIY